MAKRKRTAVGMLVAALPGVLGLGLIALGLFEVMAVHAGGHNANSRAGVCPIVGGVALLGFWSFSNKSDGYNF